MSEMLSFLNGKQEDMVDHLKSFVEQESPSHDKKLVDQMGKRVASLFQELTGGDVEVIPGGEQGDHIRGTFGSGDRQILLIGHFDTVWNEGTLENMPFHIDGDKACGPGTVDMKGGLIQGMYALHALKELRAALPVKIVFLFNSDEEIGSPSSRRWIEEEAKKSDYVLVLEGGPSIKTFRKGPGIFNLHIKGIPSHAGGAHEKGVSAIDEMAHQILFLHSLTDYEKGTTLNVGVVHGGTTFNVVAAEAHAQIDLRVSNMKEAERVVPIIKGLKPFKEGIEITVTGDMNRPPMLRTQPIVELYETTRQVAKEQLGIDLKEGATGGFSDANLSAPFAPTIDGLGSIGGGAHAVDEHLLISEMPIRSALLAHLLEELSDIQ